MRLPRKKSICEISGMAVAALIAQGRGPPPCRRRNRRAETNLGHPPAHSAAGFHTSLLKAARPGNRLCPSPNSPGAPLLPAKALKPPRGPAPVPSGFLPVRSSAWLPAARVPAISRAARLPPRLPRPACLAMLVRPRLSGSNAEDMQGQRPITHPSSSNCPFASAISLPTNSLRDPVRERGNPLAGHAFFAPPPAALRSPLIFRPNAVRARPLPLPPLSEGAARGVRARQHQKLCGEGLREREQICTAHVV
ncbi:hypothetical protein dsx2_3116 [Desulfovibrio sp. X2]|nr:hypothetical protein dsx2_3116 [Desulfovibrio sp. X2]